MRPTTHTKTGWNAVVLRSTRIYNHLRKQLSSLLNSLSHCNVKKGSCVTGNRVHIWQVPDKLNCPPVKKHQQNTLRKSTFKRVQSCLQSRDRTIRNKSSCPHQQYRTCFHVFSEDSSLRPFRFNFNPTSLLQASTLTFEKNPIFHCLEDSLCTITEREHRLNARNNQQFKR